MWCGLLISSSLLLKVECILTSYSKFTSLLLKMQTHYCRWAKHFDSLRVANNISHVACWKWLEAHSLKNNVLLHARTCLHTFWSEKKNYIHIYLALTCINKYRNDSLTTLMSLHSKQEVCENIFFGPESRLVICTTSKIVSLPVENVAPWYNTINSHLRWLNKYLAVFSILVL